MGHLYAGDEQLHYEDGSHRWVAPYGADQADWEKRLGAHKAAHAAGVPEQVRPSPRDATRPPTTGTVPPPTT